MKIIYFILLSLTYNLVLGQSVNYPGIYDEIWNSPGMNSRASMPLGNGDIGINLWTEVDGSINFFIGKTDAWDSYSSLLKVGKIKIMISPNPFINYETFIQRLDLKSGQILIKSRTGKDFFNASVRVDANNPVIRINMEGSKNYSIKAIPIIQRRGKKEITGNEKNRAYGFTDSDKPIYSFPDTMIAGEDELICFQKNNYSIWKPTLEKLGMAAWTESHRDPLLNNTFGYILFGNGFIQKNNCLINSVKNTSISIAVLSRQEEKPEGWKRAIRSLAEKMKRSDYKKEFTAHKKFWTNFWKRSYIILNKPEEGKNLAKSYTLQRFLSACAGRGKYPIKFNGSIFNLDSSVSGQPVSEDYRQWGGPYWLQNTRLIYWPMLMNGDYEMILPFFGMYFDALPFAIEQTKVLYNHSGAFFPEVMYFWGTYNLDNFGWDTDYKNFKYIKNQYIRYYFDGSLEVVSLMIEYYRHTESKLFMKDTLLPFAYQILKFYSEHYKRDISGKLKIYPSQALETYWDAVNPSNIISGLKYALSSITSLPSDLFDKAKLEFFQKFKNEIPELPIDKNNNTILSADSVYSEPKNIENPELYAVFPYPIFGDSAKTLLQNTLINSRIKTAAGWQNYDVISALLGYTDTAKKYILERINNRNHSFRFPIFWGPNYDWLPDQDHGGNLMLTLQFMLLQTINKKNALLPAWPKEWDVEFKLHAPGNKIIKGKYSDGKLKVF